MLGQSDLLQDGASIWMTCLALFDQIDFTLAAAVFSKAVAGILVLSTIGPWRWYVVNTKAARTHAQ